jgi:hypothetical protein
VEKGVKEEESKRRVWREVFQDGVAERGGEREGEAREGGFQRKGEGMRGRRGRMMEDVGCDAREE